MKRIFIFILIILISIESFSQTSNDIRQTSKSKAVQFMEKDGSFLKKEYYNLGVIKGVECEVIIITDLKDGTKIGCLTLKTSNSGYMYSGTLDADELSAAIQSLEFINKEVLPNEPTKHTEYIYISRDEVRMGIYSYSYMQYNTTKYKWRLFVKPNKYINSLEDFNKKHIETFIEYLKKAQAIIEEETK